MSVELADSLDLNDNRVHFQAFVRDEETKKVVQSVVSDLMLPAPRLQKGNIRDAIDFLSQNRSPRLLIVDITGSDLPISEVNELAEVCEPGVTVIAIGDRNDVGLFRELTHAGVFDYIVKPITNSLLQRSLVASADGALSSRQTGRLGKVHTFLGARGGVGNTTLIASCAQYAAHTLKRRVALVDLDLQYGALSLALDVEPNSALRDAIDDPTRIDGLFVDRAMIKKSETLFVLSSEDKIYDSLDFRWDAVDALLSQLQSRFHYVFIDVPRHSTLLVDGLVDRTDDLTIVSDTSLVGLRDTMRLVEGIPKIASSCNIRVALNKMGEFKRGEISLSEFETGIGSKVDFKIPFDPSTIAYAINSGQSIFEVGRSKASASIEKMAETIVGNKNASGKSLFANLPFWKR